MKKMIMIIASMALLSTTVMAEDVSTYLVGKSASIADVKSKLEANGFDVLATANNVVTITNKELQSTNTYLATLQVYVSGSDVRVQNPAYFAGAYLDNYKKGKFSTTINALTKALGNLSKSIEKLDSNDLGDYHFMVGMPYFNEPIIISNKDKVYEKVSKNQDILYSLTLPNGSILVGHKLSKKARGFLASLGQVKNSQILPYESLVFSNQVKVMNPKFYLALSLPQLSMGQFMKISDIPDLIVDEITNTYK
jgi:hypothetical protein